jgi:lipopolysaccharide/colanic/teichoic acid biosynthesis glycosyltransferase
MQRPSSANRLRFQVAGALSCALLPYVARPWLPFLDPSPTILLISLVGGIVASLLGMLFTRSIGGYPGVEGSAYIFPSFCISFGIILTIFFFFRIDYSRSLFLICFCLNIILFYIIYFFTQRSSQLSVGVVPGGDTSRLLSIEHVRWIPLETADANVNGLSAIAVDLRTDLPDIWDLRLADFALAGLPVYHSKHLQESLTGRVELEHLSENSFGTLSPVSAYMTFKHAVDWLAALLVAVLLMPLLLLISLFIMLDSRGSPIFRQRRIGYRGHPFVVWKFRTMSATDAAHSDADNARTAAMTSSNDMRITRIGRFLRKSRLDELPQIVNILKREMSWIGPRPEAEVLSQWYEAEIPFYRYRHIVRPGISGWAQVNQGHVAEVDAVRDKLYYDFYYIKHFSPWIDILIVARTIRTMLTGFGAR